MSHVVRAEAESSAPIETVWQLLSTVGTWPTWSRHKLARLERDGSPTPDGVGAIRVLGIDPSKPSQVQPRGSRRLRRSHPFRLHTAVRPTSHNYRSDVRLTRTAEWRNPDNLGVTVSPPTASPDGPGCWSCAGSSSAGRPTSLKEPSGLGPSRRPGAQGQHNVSADGPNPRRLRSRSNQPTVPRPLQNVRPLTRVAREGEERISVPRGCPGLAGANRPCTGAGVRRGQGRGWSEQQTSSSRPSASRKNNDSSPPSFWISPTSCAPAATRRSLTPSRVAGESTAKAKWSTAPRCPWRRRSPMISSGGTSKTLSAAPPPMSTIFVHG